MYTGPPLPQDERQKLKELPVRKGRAGGRPRLLSRSAIKQAKAHYNELLDKDPHRWSPQQDAAKHLAVNVMKLPETTWQTIEDQIVVPVLEQRGLTQRRKK